MNILKYQGVFYPTTSSVPKGSPHSGQNLGGVLGSAGTQPHLLQRYWGAALGFLAPHSEQNLPWFTVPQLQVQPAGASGRLAPHSVQNLPVAVAPQLHFQLSAAGAGAAAGWAACRGRGTCPWRHSVDSAHAIVHDPPFHMTWCAAACAASGGLQARVRAKERFFAQ